MHATSPDNRVFYEELLSVFNLIHYWHSYNNQASDFYIYSHTPVCILNEREVVRILHALAEIFPSRLKIEKVVDFDEVVGPGYIVTPPLPGEERKMPFAQVKISGSVEEFRDELSERNPSKPVTTLEGKKVHFDATTSILHVGSKAVPFEYGSKQANILAIVCDKRIHEPTDFDEIHEIVSSGDEYSAKADKSIRDSKKLINKKIMGALNTRDEFLAHKNKGLFRNY